MSPSPGISEALEALRAGRLVVMPTDTVYGVAAAPSLPHSVEGIFAVKERPHERAIPVLGASADALASVAALDDRALALAERFWPGPLTLVLARADGFTSDLGGTDRETVAVRVPDHPLALELLRDSGPLAVTSANRSGAPPCLTIDEARMVFASRVEVYLDAGRLTGTPSTIVSLAAEPVVLLRSGELAYEEVERVLTGLA